MYEAFFELTSRPFSALPAADWYFPAATIEAARRALGQALQRGTGFGLVVAPPGLGKTLLCQVLAEAFRATHGVALLNSGRLASRRALYQAILHELAQPFRGLDEGELRLALADHLLGPDCSAGLVLLVDEAHTLPLRLLDELRLLANLARHGEPRVRLVLAGAPSLEERLASPKLEAFNQRIVSRHYLGPLDSQETSLFVRAQLQAAGARHDGLFTAQALERIVRATDGVPRLVNQVCDHALVLAFAGGARTIDAAGIDEAWADLQQLPTPWQVEQSHDASEGGVIEFGALDEPEQALAPPSPRWPSTAETHDAAAERRLDEIDDRLRQLRDDFLPAGKIGPEVDFVFTEPRGLARHDSDGFDEEEVVLDRFADWQQGDARPHVTAVGDAALLSTLLRPFVEPDDDRVQHVDDTDQESPAVMATTVDTWADAVNTPWPTAPDSFATAPRVSSEVPRQERASAPRAAPAAPRDEAPAPRPTTSPQPATGVGPRRREFQGLFSRLRQR